MNTVVQKIIFAENQIPAGHQIAGYAIFLKKRSALELIHHAATIFGRTFTFPDLTPLFMRLEKSDVLRAKLGKPVKLTVKSVYECERYSIQYGVIQLKKNFTGESFPRIVIAAQDRVSYNYLDKIHDQPQVFGLTGSKIKFVAHGLIGAWVMRKPTQADVVPKRKTYSEISDSSIDSLNGAEPSTQQDSVSDRSSSSFGIVLNNGPSNFHGDKRSSPKQIDQMDNQANKQDKQNKRKENRRDKRQKSPTKPKSPSVDDSQTANSTVRIPPAQDTSFQPGDKYKGHLLQQGPRGGLFYLTATGKKAYLPKNATPGNVMSRSGGSVRMNRLSTGRLGRYKIRLSKKLSSDS